MQTTTWTWLAMASLMASLGSLHCGGDDDALTTSTSSSSSSSSGGSGAMGGGGSGATGGGGMGGATPTCLDATEYEATFSLEIAELCLLARYDAPLSVSSYNAPSWGRHGGPLTLQQTFAGPTPTDEISLTRWSPPNASTGTLTAPETIVVIDTGIVGVNPFFAGVAIDMPGDSVTYVGWADGTLVGEVLAIEGDVVVGRHDNAGYFGAAGWDSGNDRRLLISALSPLDDNAVGTSGIYAADWQGMGMATSSTIDTWGLANGPVTMDADGNAFAVMTDFNTGNQSLRGWTATAIGPGAPAAPGAELWNIAGFGSSLAAMAASDDADGLVFFQAQTFSNELVNEDVLVQPFGLAGDSIVSTGPASVGIDFVDDNTEASLMTDDQGRLWVGVGDGMGGAIFFVLGRIP
jgi:hypothetical protein